ncbi:hypothetical protein M6D81_11290 [Paenibacillus sp. J5C_2022]|uniref:hypothetical protein n=1 Tax=Paenibacillus sp. J5C2022 TaxID=2977129 RepID=UPI0021D34CD5|nr:hypothetical protein [Paenibacillus sp. J5C2022]MCU6709290.1 hypothetical protein [Paenibacillus sp. J5C2022]
MTATAKGPKIIAINETYGFTVSDREYALYRLMTIDPTKSPAYKPVEGAPVPEPYEDWRPISRYYPLKPAGMQSMLLYVTHRTVNDNFAGTNVAGYLAAIQAELSRLNTLISAAMIPEVTAE